MDTAFGRLGAKPLGLIAIGAVSLGIVAVAPVPAMACDVSSPTDISCPGANTNPANPLYGLTHPAPAAAPAQQQTVFNPGGLLSGFYSGAGLCQLGDAVCPAPPPAPSAYRPDAGPAEPNLVAPHRHHHRRHTAPE